MDLAIWRSRKTIFFVTPLGSLRTATSGWRDSVPTTLVKPELQEQSSNRRPRSAKPVGVLFDTEEKIHRTRYCRLARLDSSVLGPNPPNVRQYRLLRLAQERVFRFLLKGVSLKNFQVLDRTVTRFRKIQDVVPAQFFFESSRIGIFDDLVPYSGKELPITATSAKVISDCVAKTFLVHFPPQALGPTSIPYKGE